MSDRLDRQSDQTELREQRCPTCQQPPDRVLARGTGQSQIACENGHRWWYPSTPNVITRGATPQGPRRTPPI